MKGRAMKFDPCFYSFPFRFFLKRIHLRANQKQVGGRLFLCGVFRIRSVYGGFVFVGQCQLLDAKLFHGGFQFSFGQVISRLARVSLDFLDIFLVQLVSHGCATNHQNYSRAEYQSPRAATNPTPRSSSDAWSDYSSSYSSSSSSHLITPFLMCES